MRKRSLSIAGHRTSLALEDEFWAALEYIAAASGIRVADLIQDIDTRREGPNLSSAIRVAVLRYYQQRGDGPTPEA